MPTPQPGILEPAAKQARYLKFELESDVNPRAAFKALRELSIDQSLVIGIGPSLLMAAGVEVEGIRPFPQLEAAKVDIPSTQSALWCWLRGEDRGEIVHQTRELAETLQDHFNAIQIVDGFMFEDSRDLTGYEDGTENPEGDDALAAAILSGTGTDLDGSSFVAVQQWIHDLDVFESFSQEECDQIIGRRLADNEELDDAPASAHVKRAEQESFEPEAFMLRRSLPWSDGPEHGLMFVAFGCTLDAFEVVLRRMVGLDDGVVDGLFRFTRPITGGYYWCPPVDDSQRLLFPAPANEGGRD
jgi:putative iron-dependent peroxidase